MLLAVVIFQVINKKLLTLLSTDCHHSQRSQQRGLAVFVINHRNGNDSADKQREAKVVKAAIQIDISDKDGLFDLAEAGVFALYLAQTTEQSALRLARLARGAFQRLGPIDHERTLSCGIVLFGQRSIKGEYLLSTAQAFANKVSEKHGNQIDCHNLRI